MDDFTVVTKSDDVIVISTERYKELLKKEKSLNEIMSDLHSLKSFIEQKMGDDRSTVSVFDFRI